MKQPLLGTAATLLMMVLALAFVSLFDFPTFSGWVGFGLLCVIPMQIVAAVTWGANPGFAAGRPQPAKGLLLTVATFVVGLIVAAVTHATIGGAVSPPTPMLIMCAIVSVVITFWLAIMWGGWPFTATIKHPIAAGLVLLVAAYVINYALFRVFFDYRFMADAPVYIAAQDPKGLFPAWNALVFYLSCLAGMFFIINFELWPLTTVPGVMRQPTLGVAWTVAAIVLGGLAFYVGVVAMGMDPVAFMVRVPVPFIFGTIVVQNMLKASLFAGAKQPMKGILNVVAVVVIGELLSILYGRLAQVVTGALKPGPPTYDFEIWLATALLSVTFPLLIFYAEFFQFWPLQHASRPAEAAPAPLH